MITFNEILFIQVIAGFTAASAIANIAQGLAGTAKDTHYNGTNVIAGIISLGIIAIAFIF